MRSILKALLIGLLFSTTLQAATGSDICAGVSERIATAVLKATREVYRIDGVFEELIKETTLARVYQVTVSASDDEKTWPAHWQYDVALSSDCLFQSVTFVSVFD